MPIHNIFRLLILYLCLYALPIQPEGFLAGTLIKTPSGYSNIENLKSCQAIPSFNPVNPQHNNCNTAIIAHNTQSPADYYIKITIGDQTICCATDQKFYSYHQKKWLTAEQLTPYDFLMNDDGTAIAMDAVETIRKQSVLHTLSLNKHHIYCVSHHNIIVHNHVVVISLPHIVVRMAPVAKTILTGIGTYLSVHFAKKAAHKQSRVKNTDSDYSSSNYGRYYPDPNDPNNDKDKKKDNEHPHGIYKDAPYHHKNSGHNKSPCPDNGQRCLDYSLPTKTNQRVAIEGDKFVVLRLTHPGEYHGFKVSWENLHPKLRQIFIDHGFVKKSGKIIRQITEKFSS